MESERLSQNEAIKQHLVSGGKVTALMSVRMFGVIHLPRRIKDLKERGLAICDEWKEVVKANGKKARIKEYYLKSA